MSRVQALSLSGLSDIPAEFIRPADEREGLGDAFDQQHQEGGPRIPVVDISPFLAVFNKHNKNKEEEEQLRNVVEAVRRAATEWGVMHIAGHGIPEELMDRLRAAGTGFFALPMDAKEAYANNPAAGQLQGYGSWVATNASEHREWVDYLFHLIHPEHLADHNIWPAHLPDYVEATREFGQRVRDLASRLLSLLSLGLGLDGPNKLEEGLTNLKEEEDLLLQMKVSYYPRCPQPELAVGVQAHTDVSALSFIFHNGVPGLQVHHGGKWVTARSEPGTMVVHVGDALEILSNGRYTSVLHRSLVNREAVRVSWVVFCEPPLQAVLLRPLPDLVTPDQPARFTPRTFKEHLDVKLFKNKQEAAADDHQAPVILD